MRLDVIQTTPLTLNEVRPDRVSQKTFARETEKLFAIMPTTMHPPLLLIDAYEERAQRLARILTLANYRPYVAKTPLEAFRRFLQEPLLPQAIILGQMADKGRFAFARLFLWMLNEQRHGVPIIALPQDRFTLTRLLQQLAHELRRDVPILTLQAEVPGEAPLTAHQASPTCHVFSPASMKVVKAIWHVLPGTRHTLKVAQDALALKRLPMSGLAPRISKERRLRNSHFRQMLRAAHDLIDPRHWETLLGDVGLANYCSLGSWPPDDDERTIPAEHLSCLNQAVVFSRPDDPTGQLRGWSDRGVQISLERRTPSMLTQQVLKILPEEKVMSAMLKAFTAEMNEIRGEELHFWKQRPGGGYWVVHYSNLYAYGRLFHPEPACHAWTASIEATLRLLHRDSAWKVSEVECSCQTQTGHCVFALLPRHRS
jgi:hypothetical protein